MNQYQKKVASDEGVPDFFPALVPCCIGGFSTDTVIYVIAPLILMCYLFGGAILFMEFEDWPFWEALYFCVISLATVGYGDVTPATNFEKIVTVVYLYIGIAFVAGIVGGLVGLMLGGMLEEERNQGANDTTPGGKSAWYQLDQDKSEILRACLLIAVLTVIGSLVYMLNEGMSTVNAVYFCMITLATVGYGDIDQRKESTKIFDIVFILIGVPLMGLAVSKFAKVSRRRHQQRWVKQFEEQGVTMDMIRTIDRDNSGTIDRHEFLSYILLYMGKVKAIEINSINELFDTLDADGGGTLDVNDFKVHPETNKVHVVNV